MRKDGVITITAKRLTKGNLEVFLTAQEDLGNPVRLVFPTASKHKDPAIIWIRTHVDDPVIKKMIEIDLKTYNQDVLEQLGKALLGAEVWSNEFSLYIINLIKSHKEKMYGNWNKSYSMMNKAIKHAELEDLIKFIPQDEYITQEVINNEDRILSEPFLIKIFLHYLGKDKNSFNSGITLKALSKIKGKDFIHLLDQFMRKFCNMDSYYSGRELAENLQKWYKEGRIKITEGGGCETKPSEKSS